jgi:hypothetical protein
VTLPDANAEKWSICGTWTTCFFVRIMSTGQTFSMEGRKKFEPYSYEVRPRSDRHGVYLISDRLPFGRLWYLKPDDAIADAKFYSGSHDALIRVYDDAGKLIETHEYHGDFKEVD